MVAVIHQWVHQLSLNEYILCQLKLSLKIFWCILIILFMNNANPSWKTHIRINILKSYEHIRQRVYTHINNWYLEIIVWTNLAWIHLLPRRGTHWEHHSLTLFWALVDNPQSFQRCMTIQIINLHTPRFRFPLLCLTGLENIYIHGIYLCLMWKENKMFTHTYTEELMLSVHPVVPSSHWQSPSYHLEGHMGGNLFQECVQKRPGVQNFATGC